MGASNKIHPYDTVYSDFQCFTICYDGLVQNDTPLAIYYLGNCAKCDTLL